MYEVSLYNLYFRVLNLYFYEPTISFCLRLEEQNGPSSRFHRSISNNLILLNYIFFICIYIEDRRYWRAVSNDSQLTVRGASWPVPEHFHCGVVEFAANAKVVVYMIGVVEQCRGIVATCRALERVHRVVEVLLLCEQCDVPYCSRTTLITTHSFEQSCISHELLRS